MSPEPELYCLWALFVVLNVSLQSHLSLLDPMSTECSCCSVLHHTSVNDSPSQKAAFPFVYLEFPYRGLKSASDSGCVTCAALVHALEGAAVGRNLPTAATVHFYIPTSITGRFRVKISCVSAQENVDLEIYALLSDHHHSTSESASTPWHRFLVGSEVPSEPLLKGYADVLLQWLRQCQRHGKCNSKLASTMPLPSRILDLECEEGHVRLVDGRGVHGSYVALSHCWGSSTERMPKSYRTSFKSIIGFERLPLSFRDAVNITRVLGFRYLWIDALCILQDDPDDWGYESAHMLEYYSQAALVVCASRSRSSEEGFLGRRAASRAVAWLAADQHQSLVVRPYHIHFACDQDHSQSAPLDKRAWALQERLTATKVVHFHEHEMIWECQEVTLCECGMLSGPRVLLENGDTLLKDRVMDSRNSSHKTAVLLQGWYTLVEQYTKCELTHDDDRLPALTGLAELFHQHGLGEYHEGMWYGSNEIFLRCMLWKRKTDAQTRRPGCYVAPHWSWASLIGRIDWEALSLDPHLEFIPSSLTATSQPNRFGQVEGATLTLTTRTLDVRLEEQPLTGFVRTIESRQGIFRSKRNCYVRHIFQLHPGEICRTSTVKA